MRAGLPNALRLPGQGPWNLEGRSAGAVEFHPRIEGDWTLKQQAPKDVYLVVGSVVTRLIKTDLIDELRLTVTRCCLDGERGAG